jgi:hypothetical protein
MSRTMTADAIEHDRAPKEVLCDLVHIIDKAGLENLMRGVQLGQVSWYVKASERLTYARWVIGCTNFQSGGRGCCRNCGHFHGPDDGDIPDSQVW